jgi:hypothetical protein
MGTAATPARTKLAGAREEVASAAGAPPTSTQKRTDWGSQRGARGQRERSASGREWRAGGRLPPPITAREEGGGGGGSQSAGSPEPPLLGFLGAGERSRERTSERVRVGDSGRANEGVQGRASEC